MAQTVKKPYKSYIMANDLKALVDVKCDKSNLDHYYMLRQLKPSITYLFQNGITQYQDFAQLFKKYKMKADDTVKFIKSFEIYINSKKIEKKIIPLSTRELKKANFNEKNILISHLFLEYQAYIFNFFSEYYCFFTKNITNFECFLDELSFKINELLRQKEINDLNKMEEEIKRQDLTINNVVKSKSTITDILHNSTNKSCEFQSIDRNNFVISGNYVKKIMILK